jgi:hypothetical protein
LITFLQFRPGIILAIVEISPTLLPENNLGNCWDHPMSMLKGTSAIAKTSLTTQAGRDRGHHQNLPIKFVWSIFNNRQDCLVSLLRRDFGHYQNFPCNLGRERFCRNPILGLVIEARVCKVSGQKGSQESHNILPGVWEGVREWTFTPPREFHFGSWSPNGPLNFQRTITCIKTQWLETFLISLESSWNLHV